VTITTHARRNSPLAEAGVAGARSGIERQPRRLVIEGGNPP
jgi:hypothetical protein